MNIDESYPLLLIGNIEQQKAAVRDLLIKEAVSSLLRSLFSGNIVVIRNSDMPLFKVQRAQVEEIYIPKYEVDSKEKNSSSRRCCWMIMEFLKHVELSPRQWVMIADPASLAIRNIDHLIPTDLSGEFAPPKIDFLWEKRRQKDSESAVSGFWATRAEFLPLIVNRWADLLDSEPNSSECEIWNSVVKNLHLKKRRFEKGEVVSPCIGCVDWCDVSNAAFITVPEWSPEDAWRFLHSMYLGYFLGDASGLVLNVMEA